MIHLDGVLGLPGLLSNVGYGMIIDAFYGKYFILLNEVNGFPIGIIYHHYAGFCFRILLFLGSLQDFLVEAVYPFELSVKTFRIFSVPELKSLISVPDV